MVDLFDYREKYPNAPGYKKRATAKKAAEDMKPEAPTLQDQCLAVLARVYPRGMTADQIAVELGRTPLCIRPRITELFAKSLIFDTGLTSRNDSGKSAVVWAYVHDGRKRGKD